MVMSYFLVKNVEKVLENQKNSLIRQNLFKKHGKYPQKFKKRQHVNFKSQTYGNSTSNLWEPGSQDPRILEVCPGGPGRVVKEF